MTKHWTQMPGAKKKLLAASKKAWKTRVRRAKTDEEFPEDVPEQFEDDYPFTCRRNGCGHSFKTKLGLTMHEVKTHKHARGMDELQRSKANGFGNMSFNENLVTLYKWKVLAKDDIKRTMIVQIPME